MDELLKDDIIINEAMHNAYLIVTAKLTFEDLLDRDLNYLPYNPSKNIIKEDVYDALIDYFCDIEEYEKCEEIKNAKDEKFSKQDVV